MAEGHAAPPPGAAAPDPLPPFGRGPGREHRHRPRTGDEPTHARSPLRMRLVLSLIGVGLGVLGILYYALIFHAEAGDIAFALFTAVSAVNTVVVARHIRQGPHYQPGRDVPPYRPVAPLPSERTRPPRPVSTTHRRRRYFVLMGICFLLIGNAWTWVQALSIPAALIMSAAAALIPPLASVVTNAGSPILRDEPGPPDPADPRHGSGRGDGPGDGREGGPGGEGSGRGDV